MALAIWRVSFSPVLTYTTPQLAVLGLQVPSPSAVSVESTRKAACVPVASTPRYTSKGEFWLGSIPRRSKP